MESVLAEKLAVLRPVLDERQWRLLLGAEARALGHGGIAVVARASGAARSTVSIGLREVRAGVVADGRVRAPGAGRRPVGEAQPGVEQASGGCGRAGDAGGSDVVVAVDDRSRCGRW